MSKTTDVQEVNVPNGLAATDNLRPFIQQLSLKTMQLGQLVLDLYAQGQLTHTAIAPLCDDLLALEKTWPTASVASDKPVETATAVPTPDPAAPHLPEEPAVIPAPVPLPAPTHCPQCHVELAPGKNSAPHAGFPWFQWAHQMPL
ncbi:MAG: hypothetical protein M5U34_47240 [Chloroflexi bacterium]|nr:hypothetical protein [Chloroflexota bacterium]